MAETDPLTGLLNRRIFEDGTRAAIEQAEMVNDALTVVVVDLDLFKSVNDNYGHATGDTVLKITAEKLGLSVRRGSDLVGRMGGEEFAICLPRAEAAHGRRIAESLRAALAGTRIPTNCGKFIRVTASFGVATLLPGEDFQALFERADQALYAAKKAGRNCVKFARPDQKILEQL
jgi:diguanylate cyclase (GGDEF)-like protein